MFVYCEYSAVTLNGLRIKFTTLVMGETYQYHINDLGYENIRVPSLYALCGINMYYES